MIELVDVRKTYGSVAAVDGVNLAIAPGETCVLIGPSGCGKTTTLKMINRVIEPSAGTIRIRGRDARDLDAVALRRSIGYVIQQIGLFPHMSVEANVAIVPRLAGMPPAQRRTRAAELLALVGLPPEEFLDRHPKALSGGQQQRVGVARALAADPEIVLMDEPFGSVDPLVRRQLQRELKRIQGSVHKTIVLVTHDLAEALYLGDRIALMQRGRIVQVGTPAELLFHPAAPFVSEFFADHRDLAQLGLRPVTEIMAPPTRSLGGASGTIAPTGTLLDAIRLFSAPASGAAASQGSIDVVDPATGAAIGVVTPEALLGAVAAALGGDGGPA
ncbi:MAG: ABC transporter ATP-binding protein [Alphaproteobacteria bacterium]|nr:ABC transporter ATP-binding protein [Alphaproteobacteria bacterium]